MHKQYQLMFVKLTKPLARLFARLPGLCPDLDRTRDPEGYEFRQPPAAVAVWGQA